jgi:hypothetical protein
MIPVMIIGAVVGVCVGWYVWRDIEHLAAAIWLGLLAAGAGAIAAIVFEKLLSEGMAGRIPLWWLF